MTLLDIPKESEWIRFLENNGDNACSGLTNCEYCLKKLYPRRHKYLKSWLNIYRNNIDRIKSGEAIMPKLIWVAADTAEINNLEEFHKSKCINANLNIKECNCPISLFMRIAFHDETEYPSLQIIYNTSRKYIGYNQHSSNKIP